jgi:hypothetical protein
MCSFANGASAVTTARTPQYFTNFYGICPKKSQLSENIFRAAAAETLYKNKKRSFLKHLIFSFKYL